MLIQQKLYFNKKTSFVPIGTFLQANIPEICKISFSYYFFHFYFTFANKMKWNGQKFVCCLTKQEVLKFCFRIKFFNPPPTFLFSGSPKEFFICNSKKSISSLSTSKDVRQSSSKIQTMDHKFYASFYRNTFLYSRVREEWKVKKAGAWKIYEIVWKCFFNYI